MSGTKVLVTETYVQVQPVSETVAIVRPVEKQTSVIEVGIRGLQGPQGPQGDSGDKNYTQEFTFTDEITVTHNLNKRPAVTIVDSAGTEIIGTVEYVDANTLTVLFTNPFTGMIICN